MINNPWNTPAGGSSPAAPAAAGYPQRSNAVSQGLQPTPDYGTSTIGGPSQNPAANDAAARANAAASGSNAVSTVAASRAVAVADKPRGEAEREDPAEKAMLDSLHPDLQRAFRKARELAVQLKHFEVTPLHLLTVMAGIPSQTVREQLRQIGYDNGERVRLRKYLLHMAIDTGDMTSDDYPERPAWSSDVREQLLNRAREVAKERGDDAKITVKDIFEALKRSRGEIPVSRYLLSPEQRPKTKIQEEVEKANAALASEFEKKLRHSEAETREMVKQAQQAAHRANKRNTELTAELEDVRQSMRWLVSELQRHGLLVPPNSGQAEEAAAQEAPAEQPHQPAPPDPGAAANNGNGSDKAGQGRRSWFGVASFFF